jgi:di/tricarboxylate transporter
MNLPDSHALVTLLTAAVAFFLYTRSWLRVEMVSVLLLLTLLTIFHFFPFESRDARLTEVEVLGSFGHPALVAICCLMILGRGLTVTGALEPVVRLLMRLWGLNAALGLLVTLIVAGAASAFINDTPVMVLLLPLLLGLARRTGTSPSRTLMPVNFAVLAGGMLTAIGTSTNVLVLSIAGDLGMAPMGLLDFTPTAAAAFGVALLYLWLVAPRLLPESPVADTGAARRYEAQVELTAEHKKLVGRTLARAARAYGQVLPVTSVTRGGADAGLEAELLLEAGDVLRLHDTPDGLRDFAATFSVGQLAQAEYKQPDMRLAEVVIGNDSPLVGRMLSRVQFEETNEVKVVGRDNGATDLLHSRSPVREQPLSTGDVLLVHGSVEHIEALRSVAGLLVIDSSRDLPRTPKAPLAIAIMAMVVLLSAMHVLPIHVAAFGGVVAMIVTGCLRLEGVGSALSMEVILLIASSIALGQSLVTTGAAAWIAGGVEALVTNIPPAGQLAAFMAFAALLTNFVSNAAAATIGTPVAVETARLLGVPVEPFVLAILFGANLSYATPMAYQTNLLIMKAVGYRFSDFVRVGLPLVLLMLVVLSWLLVRRYGL